MIFCEHCFNDKEVASIICAISASNIGECPVCHHREGHLYDTSIQSELTPYFEELLNIYTPSTMLPDTYPKAETRSLIPELYDSSYLKDHALLKNNDWDSFVTEIKTKNRYHSKLINFDIL